ncbi:hypothetical protein D1816_09085 [Aquimarina sp. AD10]|nr:hypothetical protein D1816_09085 [Aquimarina sp. AD10]RKM96981.1 hypothetical protein D7033_14810 [Aquimarina sp. AD10]
MIFQKTLDECLLGGANGAFDGNVILQVEKPSKDKYFNLSLVLLFICLVFSFDSLMYKSAQDGSRTHTP